MGAIVDIYRFSSPGMGKVKFKLQILIIFPNMVNKMLTSAYIEHLAIEWDFVTSGIIKGLGLTSRAEGWGW